MDLSKLITSLTDSNMVSEISKKLNIDSAKINSVIQSAIPQFLNADTGSRQPCRTIVRLEFGRRQEDFIQSLRWQSGIHSFFFRPKDRRRQRSGIQYLGFHRPKLLSVLGNLKSSGNIGDVLGSILGGSTSQGSGKSVLGGLLNKLIKK